MSLGKRTLKDYSHISLQKKDLSGPIAFGELFGSPGPVEIEIGSGKGTFLLEQARAYPESNYLGIEWANKYYRYAVDRLGRWGLGNVRLIRTDAAGFIREHIPDGSVRVFHVYYPDPWPKKRHHKRRFVCGENLAELLRCLEPGGRIQLATDHEDYFRQMREVIDAAVAAGQVEETAFIRAAGAGEGETVGTNYERKYIPQGREVHTLAVVKKVSEMGSGNY